MQQQSLLAVKESEAKKVVVNECRNRSENDVDYREGHSLALFDDHFATERRVAIHVLDVGGEGRVLVMDEIAFKSPRQSTELYRLVD